MSVNASWGSSNYLQVSSGGAATRPFLDHGWCFASGSTSSGHMLVTGVNDTGLADSYQTGFASSTQWRARVTDVVDSGSNAIPLNAPSADEWMSCGAAYVSSVRTESWLKGDIANKGANDHVARSLSTAPAYMRIGARFDGSLASSVWRYAEISRWDITGFSETDRNALITRLSTLVSGEVPNALAVNDDEGEVWNGKLVRYWPLTDNTDLADASGVSSDTFSATGTVNTAAHPTVQTYSGTSLYPSMQPLYYGATLLANKTGIFYRVTAGHTNLNGELIAQGTNATTDASGNVVWPVVMTGAASDPVTVYLYWEEGSAPVVDRSLIVQTTLVAV